MKAITKRPPQDCYPMRTFHNSVVYLYQWYLIFAMSRTVLEHRWMYASYCLQWHLYYWISSLRGARCWVWRTLSNLANSFLWSRVVLCAFIEIIKKMFSRVAAQFTSVKFTQFKLMTSYLSGKCQSGCVFGRELKGVCFSVSHGCWLLALVIVLIYTWYSPIGRLEAMRKKIWEFLLEHASWLTFSIRHFDLETLIVHPRFSGVCRSKQLKWW